MGISIEADATYNHRLVSGCPKTPFQPATCATCAVFVAKQCNCREPGHQEGCTADLAKTAVLGDKGKYLKDTLGEISNGGLPVDAVTLDGDSNSN